MALSFKLLRIIFAVGIPLSLAGCGTASNLLSGGDQPETVASKQVTTPANQKLSSAAVTFAPIVGAPTTVSQPLAQKVAAAAAQKNIAIAPTGQPSQYTVRGYVVAAPTNGGSKLSYIWDIFDAAGKRRKRYVGEELIPGKAGSDPWANVTTPVIDRIASRSATQLASFTPIAGGSNAPAALPGATPTPLPANQPAQPKLASAAPNTPTLAAQPASLGAPVLAVVPAVLGAPGDGKVSLTNALRKELGRKGIALAKARSNQTYTVQGSVALGNASGKNQNIKIDWVVLDPKGRKVGTVTQKNAIAKGSLDKRWGPVATAAAGAAAQGIVKLLPKSN